MLIPPTEQDIFNFTLATHALDRIPLYTDQVQNTWNQKGLPNPYAQGHFRAIMYVIHKLLPSADFPAKGTELIQNVQDSHTALFWLREIHHKMADPMVGHFLLEDDANAPVHGQVGKYRLTTTMAVTKPAPTPDIIPRIMHNWLVDYGKFHARIKDKVDNPYGFDKETALEIYRRAYEVNLFFCTVQPLSCLNQRMGRLIENTFRMAWRLPMKFYGPNSPEYRELPIDLIQYQDNTLPKLVTASLTVKG